MKIARILSPVLSPMAAAALAIAPLRSAAEPFRVSLSVSPFAASVLQDGVVYTDGRMTARTLAQLQRLFVAHGANEVYARICTLHAPTGRPGDPSMDTGLRVAEMAKSLGLPFNPELGLWKTYGDSGLQPSPDFSDYPQLAYRGPWTSLTVDQMLPILRAYGALAAREILKTGVRVRIWDIGNEVDYGLAGVAIPPRPHEGDDENGPNWYRPPNAVDPAIGTMTHARLQQMTSAERVAWLRIHVWPHVGRMLEAVAEGIRTVDPQARFSTHIANSTDAAFAVAFYETVRKSGFLPDQIGFSYYPTWGKDTWPKFQETVRAIQGEFRRPVFIAEYAFPAGLIQGYYAKWNIPQPGYPLDDQGQAAFLRRLTRWGSQSGMICGIRPWAADLCGGGWGAMSFFNLEGKTAMARPALDAMAQGLAR